MTFLALPSPLVESWADVQFNFEAIQGAGLLLGSNNLSDLTNLTTSRRNLGLGGGGASVAFGGTTTGTATVTHGLPWTPARVFVTVNGVPSTAIAWGTDTFTSTQFTIHGQAAAVIAGSVSVFWEAFE